MLGSSWFEVVNFSRNDNGVTESYIIQWLVLLFVFVPKIITLIIVSNIFPRVEIEFKLPNIIWELHFLRSALQGRDPHATLVFFNPIFFFPKVPNCFCLTEKQRNVRDVAKILNKIISNLKQSTEFHSLKSELKKGAGHYWVKCQIALLRIPFVSEWDIHCNIGTKNPIHFSLSFFVCKNWILDDGITESNGKIRPSRIPIILHCCQPTKHDKGDKSFCHWPSITADLKTWSPKWIVTEFAILAIFALILKFSENEVDSYRKHIQCQLDICQIYAQNIVWHGSNCFCRNSKTTFKLVINLSEISISTL